MYAFAGDGFRLKGSLVFLSLNRCVAVVAWVLLQLIFVWNSSLLPMSIVFINIVRSWYRMMLTYFLIIFYGYAVDAILVQLNCPSTHQFSESNDLNLSISLSIGVWQSANVYHHYYLPVYNKQSNARTHTLGEIRVPYPYRYHSENKIRVSYA